MLLSEQSRRMREMARAYGGFPNMFEDEETLALNESNNLVRALFRMKDDPERAEDARLVAEHIYDLAMLGHKPLPTERMTRFIERSNAILERAVAQ
jgi:molecular chaperone HtpG